MAVDTEGALWAYIADHLDDRVARGDLADHIEEAGRPDEAAAAVLTAFDVEVRDADGQPYWPTEPRPEDTP